MLIHEGPCSVTTASALKLGAAIVLGAVVKVSTTTEMYMNRNDMPESLQAARILCSHERPYLSSLLYRLVPLATPGLKTLGVDQWGRLYFDPELKWTVPQYATVLYHECGHLLRDHAGRAESMGVTVENAAAWNICADCEINDDIVGEKNIHWPHAPYLPSKLTPKQKDGLFAEEYYDKLPKMKVSVAGPGSGKCGGAAGNPQEHELPAPPNAGGSKNNTPGLSPAEMTAVRHKVANDVREHQKSRGDVPSHLIEWAQAILEPKVDWRKVLRASIRHTMANIMGMVDYSYQRPSRRQNAVPKIVLPTMRQPVLRIAVVIDTSGSMSNDDLATVLAEVNGVLKQCGQRDGVETIVCDAAVHGVKKVFRADQIVLEGRGGTDMRLGIQTALDRPIRPHVVIVLTDGHTLWPDAEPKNVKVIAALVGNQRVNENTVPAWIRTVVVK